MSPLNLIAARHADPGPVSTSETSAIANDISTFTAGGSNESGTAADADPSTSFEAAVDNAIALSDSSTPPPADPDPTAETDPSGTDPESTSDASEPVSELPTSHFPLLTLTPENPVPATDCPLPPTVLSASAVPRAWAESTPAEPNATPPEPPSAARRHLASTPGNTPAPAVTLPSSTLPPTAAPIAAANVWSHAPTPKTTPSAAPASSVPLAHVPASNPAFAHATPANPPPADAAVTTTPASTPPSTQSVPTPTSSSGSQFTATPSPSNAIAEQPAAAPVRTPAAVVTPETITPPAIENPRERIARNAPPVPSEPHGISGAQQLALMKKASSTNEMTGPAQQNLPGSEVLPVRENLPGRSDRSAADLNAIASPSQAKPAAESAATSAPASTTALRSLERTTDLITFHAFRLRDSDDASMRVVIKPGNGLQLSLDIRQDDGGLHVRALVNRGDFQFLSQHWNDLQQQLEARGVRLAPLVNEDSLVDQNPSQQRQQSRSDDDGFETFGDFDFTGTRNPIPSQVRAGKGGKGGWEGWA